MDIPDTAENAAACLCGNCPSKVPDDQAFYCARGCSPLPIYHGFCACRWCPLWSCYSLDGDFFCDGAAAEGAAPDSADDQSPND